MPAKRAHYVLILWILLVLFPRTTLAQSDPERFAEGRVALDTHKDCPTAYRVLSGVSENGRKDAMWIYYMGKTTECLKRYGEALSYYRAYSKLIPPNAELLNKIGELQYAADKEAEEEKNARDLAAQKSEAQVLAAKRDADEREAAAKQMEEAADQKKAAQERLPQTLSRLLVLLNARGDGWTISKEGCTVARSLSKKSRQTIPFDHIEAAVVGPGDLHIYVGYTDNRKGVELVTSKEGDPIYVRSYPITIATNTQERDEIIGLFANASLACSTY